MDIELRGSGRRKAAGKLAGGDARGKAPSGARIGSARRRPAQAEQPDAEAAAGRNTLYYTKFDLPEGVEIYESDDRFTPPVLVDAMEDSFGRISLDPCWHEASAVRPEAYFDVRRGQDGLALEWFGRVAVVNPPWSNQDEWVRRGYDQWAKGNVDKVLLLVPAAVSAVFFHEVLAGVADVFFIRGRPRFSKVDGTSEGTMVNTMVVALGVTAEERARFAQRVRGSWWRPERCEPVAVGSSGEVGVAVSWTPCPVSCVADRPRGVVCGPSIARH